MKKELDSGIPMNYLYTSMAWIKLLKVQEERIFFSPKGLQRKGFQSAILDENKFPAECGFWRKRKLFFRRVGLGRSILQYTCKILNLLYKNNSRHFLLDMPYWRRESTRPCMQRQKIIPRGPYAYEETFEFQCAQKGAFQRVSGDRGFSSGGES